MKALLSSIELVRPGSSLLLFAMLFVPLAIQSHDFIGSFGRAVPMLLIGMCTFIANDLDDIDADSINHPERPLPSRTISPLLAATLYFICLASALVTTKMTVPTRTAFLYYLTIILTLSYRYVVAYVPIVKAPYAASAIAIPAVIVAHYNANSSRLYVVACAVFTFSLGRELCMDVVDRRGDERSMMHRFHPDAIGACAFLLQFVSLALVLGSRPQVDTGALVVSAGMVTLLVIAAICWFRSQRREASTALMKLQLLLGLYFLV